MAPRTISTEESRTSAAGTEPRRRCDAAQRAADRAALPPPSAEVVNGGNQELTVRPAANSATNQPGCGRAMTKTLSGFAITAGRRVEIAFAHARSHHRSW